MAYESYETNDQYRYPERSDKNGPTANEGRNWFSCHVEEFPDDVWTYR